MYRTIAIAAICAASLCGQTPAGPKTAVIQGEAGVRVGGDMAEFGPIGITGAMAGPMSTIAGAPYSAQAVTQRVQMLADGNRIEQSTSGSVARDSQGRVRRDEVLPGLSGSNGDAPHLVMIEDPVAGVHWTLDAQTKTAVKMPSARIKALPAKLGTPGAPPLAPPAEDTFFFTAAGPGPGPGVHIISKSEISADSKVNKTDLGAQNIEGVMAQGTRTARTIPAGTIGNDLPIVITTETWYSPELKVLVLSKTSDPRMGETTYKLTDIQRAEPAASLFQVPDDYTIRDQPANNFVYQVIKKNP